MSLLYSVYAACLFDRVSADAGSEDLLSTKFFPLLSSSCVYGVHICPYLLL